MKYIFILLFLISNLFSTELKQVLLLHSYNKGLKWSDGVSKGVDQVFAKHLDSELTTEYMDSKKIDTQEYFDFLLELYKKKFSSRKYEVVMVSDNHAFEFVLKNYDKLFKNTPIVFCGVENFDKEKIPEKLKSLVTGVIEYKEIKRNIELIYEVISDLDTLYIISDNSLSSKAIKNQILRATIEYKNRFRVIFDDSVDIKTLTSKINNLPKKSAVLFTSLYKDYQKKYISYSKIRDFFHSSKIPVFAVNKVHLNEGIVGGIMLDPIDQGVQAANKVFEIIDGVKPQDIDISTPSSKYYFDYKALDRYKLTKADIPMLSFMINKPKDFFEENREFVDATFVLMPLLVILVIALIVNITKKVNLEIKLQEQNRLDNVLLNNITSSIYWENNDNILLGCNDSLSELLNRRKEFLIGKNTKDLMPELYSSIEGFDRFKNKEFETEVCMNSKLMNLFIRRKEYLTKNDKEAGIVTVIADVTELRKLELEKKKKEQFEIQRSKLAEVGEMITSIAHQWKTPLIEISTIAQELLHKRKKRDVSFEEIEELMGESMVQVDYMSKTIDDFRNFIRPSVKKSNFNMKNAIDELLNVFDHNLRYNYIDININYADEKDYIINGYPNEFKQSILGVINNAKDSILKRRQRDEEFDAKIDILVSRGDNNIFLNIKDNGIGIEKKSIKKIFEPFYSTKLNGDGFGLYMVKLIIEDKMDGRIDAIYSKKGANFLISLKEAKDENITA